METIDIERVIKSPESIVHYLREAPCDPLKRDAADLIEDLGRQVAEAQKKALWAENDLLKLRAGAKNQSAVSEKLRDAVCDAIAGSMNCLYVCTRSWSAWAVDTMSQHDFHSAGEDSDVVNEITDAAIAAMQKVSV